MGKDEKVPVLIVDDRPENLKSLEALLEDMQLDLVRALSGNEALRQILHADFALVLLDVQMPEMDGFETAELIRRNPRTRQLPIVFVTAGMKEERYLFKGYEAGAVDYLMKPIDPTILRSKVAVFCELYRQRRELELQEEQLEAQVIERTRELAETAELLLRSKERYQRLLESIISYVYTVTIEDGRPVRVTHSAACVSITGYEECEYDGDLWSRIILPEDRNALENAAELLMTDKQPVSVQYRISHKDGNERWIINTLVPNLGDGGELLSYDGIVADITERKRLEEQLLQSQKMESIGRLAGGVAHEFNNMLSVILGSAELLKRDVAEEDPPRKYLDNIVKAAERSGEMTRQLLAFSRKGVTSPKTVDLNKLVAESGNMLQLLIGEDIRLSFHPAEELWTVRLDPAHMEQILMNLAANARDAMPDGGNLVIELSNVLVNGEYSFFHDARPGEYVQLAVSDTGVGMDRQTREHIFEPFFTTKQAGKGTGLGLATVYGIITQNNGFIDVSSEPGQGTTFRIYLPRSREEAVVEKTAVQSAPAGTEKILLVEDEEMLLQVIASQLQAMGYLVIKAASPQEAISIIEGDQEIDLILTDVVMPGMSGPEMVERIHGIRPGIKVLFMSGYTAESVVQRGVVEKGVHCLQKPLELNKLNRKIREILQGVE